MTTPNTDITWEMESDNEAISTCGRFTASLDPVYGYWCLHDAEDQTVSLAEDYTLTGLSSHAALFAQQMAA